jgi:hypothetical protein
MGECWLGARAFCKSLHLGEHTNKQKQYKREKKEGWAVSYLMTPNQLRLLLASNGTRRLSCSVYLTGLWRRRSWPVSKYEVFPPGGIEVNH